MVLPSIKKYIASPFLYREMSTENQKNSPALVHLYHYVATADEFSANVQLGDGRPLAIRLYPLTYLVVGQYVDSVKIDAVRLQYLTCRIREAALGEEL